MRSLIRPKHGGIQRLWHLKKTCLDEDGTVVDGKVAATTKQALRQPNLKGLHWPLFCSDMCCTLSMPFLSIIHSSRKAYLVDEVYKTVAVTTRKMHEKAVASEKELLQYNCHIDLFNGEREHLFPEILHGSTMADVRQHRWKCIFLRERGGGGSHIRGGSRIIQQLRGDYGGIHREAPCAFDQSTNEKKKTENGVSRVEAYHEFSAGMLTEISSR